MPDTRIYIRQDDWETWAALENKAEFVHEALSKLHKPSVTIKKAPHTDVFYTQPKQAVGPTTPAKGANLCKIHNLPLTVFGKCLQKGCRYA